MTYGTNIKVVEMCKNVGRTKISYVVDFISFSLKFFRCNLKIIYTTENLKS